MSIANNTEKRKLSDELLTRLARNIKALRKFHGLSQRQLAEKCGCHPSFISMVERKQRNVTISTLEVFAIALKVDTFQLLNDDFTCGIDKHR